MKRGEVYLARLNPVEGSEQGGNRPVIIVSRDAINASSPVVLTVPCTSYQPGKQIFLTQVLIRAGEGGLDRDSIVKADQVQVLAKTRLLRGLGNLSDVTILQLNRALLIALDLPGQDDIISG